MIEVIYQCILSLVGLLNIMGWISFLFVGIFFMIFIKLIRNPSRFKIALETSKAYSAGLAASASMFALSGQAAELIDPSTLALAIASSLGLVVLIVYGFSEIEMKKPKKRKH